jgi:hypothetical protein
MSGWGSWEWAGARIAKQLAKWFSVKTFQPWEQIENRDVVIIVKHLLPSDWQLKVSRSRRVIYVPVDPLQGTPSYESWWDVPVAEISEQADVRVARTGWESNRRRQRYFL